MIVDGPASVFIEQTPHGGGVVCKEDEKNGSTCSSLIWSRLIFHVVREYILIRHFFSAVYFYQFFSLIIK
jgi:hypothetical protein